MKNTNSILAAYFEGHIGTIFERTLKHLISREPTTFILQVNSPGGTIQSAIEIVERLSKYCANPINNLVTINVGECKSCAVPIFCMGIERYALKDSKFLLHFVADRWKNRPSNTVSIEEIEKKEYNESKWMAELVASRAGIDTATIWDQMKENVEFDVKRAVDLGIVNQTSEYQVPVDIQIYDLSVPWDSYGEIEYAYRNNRPE